MIDGKSKGKMEVKRDLDARLPEHGTIIIKRVEPLFATTSCRHAGGRFLSGDALASNNSWGVQGQARNRIIFPLRDSCCLPFAVPEP